jgi:hypothetical protein
MQNDLNHKTAVCNASDFLVMEPTDDIWTGHLLLSPCVGPSGRLILQKLILVQLFTSIVKMEARQHFETSAMQPTATETVKSVTVINT